MHVPQFVPYIGIEEYKEIESCFVENWITEGPKSQAFISKLCDIIGTQYAVLAPNGTLALYMALRVMGIGYGDEVIVPDFTFIASANAVEMTGAIPIFADIHLDTLQIDIDSCEKIVSSKTKAIMPVHIYGMAVDMDQIMQFASRHNLMVIEDAAQAIGVSWKNRHCGNIGDIGTFSFFADKTITTGEGGLVVTKHKHIYELLLYFRNQGRLNRGSFQHPEIGYNFRMTDIQAAIGLAQLNKLDLIIKNKQRILKRYKDNLSEFHIVEPVSRNSNHIPFRVALLYDRDVTSIMRFLTREKIETRTFFFPLHSQPCYRHKYGNKSDTQFPNTTDAYRRGICLPSFPTMTNKQIDYVCDKIRIFK